MTRRPDRDPRCVLLLAATLASPACTAAGDASAPTADVAAVVEQPRPFGHVVGDVLTQRVLLDATRPAALPAPQRLSAWIERRPARLERAADGRRWLVVDYQLVNAPRAPVTVRIPPWRLAGAAGQPALLVAAWPIGVSAITARAAPGTEAWQLRPDRPAPAIATRPLRLRLLLASAALAACLACWAGWLAWRGWREAMTQPFAAALRRLAREDERLPSAWRTLHEAFDRTAGEVLRMQTLPRLFERAPQFEPLQGRIEDFYAQSAARFFGNGDAAPAAGATSPLALCRDLRRIERGSRR